MPHVRMSQITFNVPTLWEVLSLSPWFRDEVIFSKAWQGSNSSKSPGFLAACHWAGHDFGGNCTGPAALVPRCQWAIEEGTCCSLEAGMALCSGTCEMGEGLQSLRDAVTNSTV